jgi:CO/xanthine dehydrogenase FAD-binding subunit
MFSITELAQPETIEEAYRILTARANNVVLGGGAFLRLGSRKVGTAIDLSRLNLGEIEEENDYIKIGAMATFRALETSPVLNSCFCGVLPKAAGNVVGVQFRNIVTTGATVYTKYGFSDMITALLVLDTQVDLYKGGLMPLNVFLDSPRRKDVLLRIWIKKEPRQAAYQSLRNSAADLPILNVAVSRLGGDWVIAAGARPLRAKVAAKASDLLSAGTVSPETIEHAAGMAAAELSFGTNARGSASYRQAMCRVLVKRAVTEVLQCK